MIPVHFGASFLTHRVEVGRAQLDRVRQARVKKDAPKWTDSDLMSTVSLFVKNVDLWLSDDGGCVGECQRMLYPRRGTLA